jgi:hypothetical protein
MSAKKSDKSRTKVGHKSDKSRTKVGQKSDKSRTKFGQNSDKSWTKVGQKSDKSREKVGKKSGKSRTRHPHVLSNKVALTGETKLVGASSLASGAEPKFLIFIFEKKFTLICFSSSDTKLFQLSNSNPTIIS